MSIHLKPGTRVRMTESLKRSLMRAKIYDHVDEFGSCVGEVIKKVRDGQPHVLVRWSPSNLEFDYHPSLLEIVMEN